MLCLYKQKDGFHANYYSTKFTCNAKKDKLHNIAFYASRKILGLQSYMRDSSLYTKKVCG